MSDPLSKLRSGSPGWVQFVERLVPDPHDRDHLQRTV